MFTISEVTCYVSFSQLIPSLFTSLHLQFGNNVANFILSSGPQTTKVKDEFKIDWSDDAVQNMLISYEGMARWPEKITPFTLSPPQRRKKLFKNTLKKFYKRKMKSNFKHLLKTLESQRKLRRHFFCLACRQIHMTRSH